MKSKNLKKESKNGRYFVKGFTTSTNHYGIPNSKNMSPEALATCLNKMDNEYEFFVENEMVMYRPYARKVMVKA